MKLKFRIISLATAVFTIALTMSSCKKEAPYDGYTITGTVNGLDNGWVKLIEINHIDRDATKIIDSAQIQNGIFKMKGKVAYVDMVELAIDKNYGGTFFLENIELNIELDVSQVDKSDEVQMKIKGSNYQNILNAQSATKLSIWNKEKYTIVRDLKAESIRVYGFTKDHPDTKKMMQGYDDNADLISEVHQKMKDSDLQFVKNNPDSPVSPNILIYMYEESSMTKDEMNTYYHLLKGSAKNTAAYKYIAKRYTDIFKSLAVGAVAPDFTLPKVEGGNLTMSRVSGKYIFVDFWASWCKPCRAKFPHLKELYKKYKKDGFNVLAVGTADAEVKWRKAIKEDETLWNNIFDSDPEAGKAFSYGLVAKQYGVAGLPTTFLLDENKEIVLRNPTKDELNVKLEELFGY